MINVKGTKNASPEAAASQRYVLKSDDEVSRTPMAIASLLIGIGVYLSSLFARGRDSESQSPPNGVAEESGSPGEVVDETASPRQSKNLPDAESPGSATQPVAGAPQPMFLRYPDESVDVPGAVRAANGNTGGAEIAGRVGNTVTAPLGDTTISAGGHPALGGVGSSSGQSLPDNPPVGGNDPTDGGGATDDDPLEAGGDDDVCGCPGSNRAPQVSDPVYLQDIAPCATLFVASDDLLSKTEDPDGDALSIQNLAVSSGTLTEVEGGWVFQSDSGQPELVTLTYQVTDGMLTTGAVARFSVVGQPTGPGVAANDMLLGSMYGDEADDAEGSDTLDYSQATEGLVVDLVNGSVSGVEIDHDSIIGFEKVLGGRGGERPNADSHLIMDVGVGDRIRMSEYDIFWQTNDEPEDRFGQIYRDKSSDDLPIRYRHDRDEGSEWSVIETDFEEEGIWSTAVTLQGTHKLSWSTERDDGLEWLS